MRWAGLRGNDEREEVFNYAFGFIYGTGGLSDYDYVAIFCKRYNGYSFYILKYGCRTIYERSWDDEWYDVYNWNAVLVVKKPNGEFEYIDDIQFTIYEEVNKKIEEWFREYPEKYFSGEKEEEDDVEFPEWAKKIVSDALLELTPENIDEIKAKLSGTALCVEPKLLKKAYELLESKVELLKR